MRLKETPEDFLVREILTPKIEPGNYSLYLLKKRLWNTEDCIQWLAKSLNTPRNRIGVCGQKDRHAVTEQYITIERGPQTVRTPEGFTLTYLGTVKDALRLGAHERNAFTITVRELPEDTAKPILKPIKNYFGEQRMSTQNADVGFALLKKDYKKAATLLNIPFTTDPISALRSVPKYTLILYAHAAQSVLWNELAETLPAVQDDIPMGGYDTQGNKALLPAMMSILARHELTMDAFVNRSMQELSLEGGSRPLLQDVQDFTATEIENGVCTISFSLGKGSYATETIRQLFD